MSSYEDNIEQSIQLILGTAVGERLMDADFGSYIHDYVFHPNNPGTSSTVAFYAQQALKKHEPRVKDVQIRAFTDPNNENVMMLDIKYQVIHDNEMRNLVYPFYLRREQDL